MPEVLPLASFVFEGIVGNLATDLLKAAGRSMRSDAVQLALKESLAEALTDALSAYPLSALEEQHYKDLFERFFRQEEVVRQLLALVDPRPDRKLSLTFLAERLENSEIDPDLLPDFEAEEFFKRFIRAFLPAVARHRALHGTLQIQLISKVLVEVGELSQSGERTVVTVQDLVGRIESLLDAREAPTWNLLSGAWVKYEQGQRAYLRSRLENRENLETPALQGIWSEWIRAEPWHEHIGHLVRFISGATPPGLASMRMAERLQSLDLDANYLAIAEELRSLISREAEQEIHARVRELERQIRNTGRDPEEDEPWSPEIQALRRARALRARVAELKQHSLDPTFRRCLLCCGSVGSGKTHWTIALDPYLRVPGAGPKAGWRCLFLWLDPRPGSGPLDEMILQEIRKISGYPWASLAAFDRHLRGIAEALKSPAGVPRLVVVIDDLHRRIKRRPDLLVELRQVIATTTQIHSLFWVLAVLDTAYDRVTGPQDEEYWRLYSATPAPSGAGLRRRRRPSRAQSSTAKTDLQMGSWLWLDAVNLTERVGLKILQRASPDLSLLQIDPADLSPDQSTPSIAWIVLDYSDRIPVEQAINLHFVGFVEIFWKRRWERLQEDAPSLKRSDLNRILRLVAGAILEQAELNPGKSDVVRYTRQSPADPSAVELGLDLLESAGLLQLEGEEDPFSTEEKIILRVFFFWYFQLGRELYEVSTGSWQQSHEEWFAHLGDYDDREGILEFLLLIADDERRDDQKLRDKVIPLWRWALECRSLPQGGLWLAAAKASGWAQQLAAGFAREAGVRSQDRRTLFTFLYFVAHVRSSVLDAPARAELVQKYFRAIHDNRLETFCCFVLERIDDSIKTPEEWVKTAGRMAGCEVLGRTDRIGDLMSATAAVLSGEQILGLLKLFLSYLRKEAPDSRGEAVIRPWKRTYVREWILATGFDRIVDWAEQAGWTPADLFRELQEADWYDPSRFGIGTRIGIEMEREANIALGNWYRFRSDEGQQKDYEATIQGLVESGHPRGRTLAFFMIHHTGPILEEVSEVPEVFHPLLEEIFLDYRLERLVERFRGEFKFNFKGRFAALEKKRQDIRREQGARYIGRRFGKQDGKWRKNRQQ